MEAGNAREDVEGRFGAVETKMDKGRVSVDGIDLDRAVRTDGHGFGLGKVNLVEQEIVIVVIKVVVIIVVVAGRGRRRRREEGGEGGYYL